MPLQTRQQNLSQLILFYPPLLLRQRHPTGPLTPVFETQSEVLIAPNLSVCDKHDKTCHVL